MSLLLLLACHKRVPEPDPALVAPVVSDPAARTPAGVVRDGVWTDALYPFSLAVPPGWTAVPGADPSLRLTLQDPATGTVVEVRAVPGSGAGPTPRPGCTWDFVDTARYRVLHLPVPITVATCSPAVPDEARVLGWYFGDVEVSWQVEAAIPNGALDAGVRGVEGMLGSVRLR